LNCERDRLLEAARVPERLSDKILISGPEAIWSIEHHSAPPDEIGKAYVGWGTYTVLRRLTESTMHIDGKIVMEDSVTELSKHLPILLAGRGRILITGLGLGCVVRGLLSKPDVEHIDVVEIDKRILHWVGREFGNDPRVELHLGDALKYEWPEETRWDFAWHDIHEMDGDEHVSILHCKLMQRFRKQVTVQGAWGLKPWLKRALPWNVLG
jgi:hypothetical protein